MRFACSMGFSAKTDRMVLPPSLSRDRKWLRVNKCTHSPVVGLRCEGNYCYSIILSIRSHAADANLPLKMMEISKSRFVFVFKTRFEPFWRYNVRYIDLIWNTGIQFDIWFENCASRFARELTRKNSHSLLPNGFIIIIIKRVIMLWKISQRNTSSLNKN